MKLLGVLIIAICIVASKSKVYLDDDNALQNILIFIKDGVPEGDGSLLKNIKTYFTKASKALYTATSKMPDKEIGVKFGKIFIRIPNAWKTKSNMVTWQNCNRRQFTITKLRENNNVLFPFTKQIGGCGDPASYTRIPFDYFKSTDTEDVRKSGIQIMREFTKLRYGVFSELPYKKQLTYFDGNKFAPSTCGANIKWTINRPPALCSYPNPFCDYTINSGQKHTYSVMFDSDTSTSVYFCDNKNRLHNGGAHNLHNRKCDSRSIAEVISDHSDFKENKNLPSDYNQPDFEIVKGGNRRIVLTIDTSSSMKDNGKLNKAKAAMEVFVKDIVEDTASVGLVTFANTATTILELTPMNTKSNKKKVINAIRGLTYKGATNIGDSLSNAYNLLTSTAAQKDGVIILLTDGENNQEPNLYQTMIKKLIDSGTIIVNSISYTKTTDPNLYRLANGTLGRYLYADPLKSYVDLMKQLAMQDCNDRNTSVMVLSGTKTFNPGTPGKSQDVVLAKIDEFMGNEIRFTATIDIQYKDAVLVDPVGAIYISVNDVPTDNNRISKTFDLKTDAKAGFYKLRTVPTAFKRYKRDVKSSKISFIVMANNHESSTRIIQPEGSISVSKIQTIQSQTMVTLTIDLSSAGIQSDETVNVQLNVTGPNSFSVVMQDNGIGADSIAGDQIYSGNIVAENINAKGFYIISGFVEIRRTGSKPSIERTVSFDTLEVVNAADSISDVIPPARIDNVTISIVDSKKKQIIVSFLATGDNGLYGEISDYDIVARFKNNTVKQEFAMSKMAPPLTKIDFLVNVTVDTGSSKKFSVEVRGIDRAKNYGAWSPAALYNWDYKDIFDKYSKSSSAISCNIILVATVLFGFLASFVRGL